MKEVGVSSNYISYLNGLKGKNQKKRTWMIDAIVYNYSMNNEKYSDDEISEVASLVLSSRFRPKILKALARLLKRLFKLFI